MKDKEKQIEEIQKIMEYCCNVYDDKGRHIRNKCNTFDCEYYCDTNDVCCSFSKKEATALYNAGYRKLPKDSVVVSKEWWDKSRTQKTFKFYKDENLSKELYLIPYSVCIRPSEDNMSLLSLYKTLVWCGYASENYWDWCENTKKAKEVSFYEYIDELIKAIQAQARKETAEKIIAFIETLKVKEDGRHQWREDHNDCIDKVILKLNQKFINGIEIKE